MKLRTLTFVTAMSLSSTLAFASDGSTGSFVVASPIGDPSDVMTSGALDPGATESLSRGSRDRSNTNLNPSDPHIGQIPRDAWGSINKVDRSDRNSVINRNRW
jgi:hypothetical protein